MRLIPFHIFSHEGQFEVYNNEQRLKELKAKYQNCYTNNRTIMGRGKEAVAYVIQNVYGKLQVYIVE